MQIQLGSRVKVPAHSKQRGHDREYHSGVVVELPDSPRIATVILDNGRRVYCPVGIMQVESPIESARALLAEIGDDIEAIESTGGLIAAGVALFDVSDADGEDAVDEADELLGELSVIYNAVVGNDDDEAFVGGLYIQAVEARWTEQQS